MELQVELFSRQRRDPFVDVLLRQSAFVHVRAEQVQANVEERQHHHRRDDQQGGEHKSDEFSNGGQHFAYHFMSSISSAISTPYSCSALSRLTLPSRTSRMT